MKKLLPLTFLTSLLIFAFIGCLDDAQTPQQQNFVQGSVVAEFVDAETTQPLEGEEFSVSLFFDSVGDFLFVEGIRETDEDGILEILIEVQSDQQESVSAINFFYEGTNLDIDEITEDINLTLRFQEPFDQEQLFFEIETDDTQ